MKMRISILAPVGYLLVAAFLTGTKASAQSSTNCPLVMNCPSNIVVTSCFNVQEFYNPTAFSSCCGVLYTNVVCTPPSGSIFAVGTTTTVNCMATDCLQNTNFCSFTVTVQPGSNCATNYLQVQCPTNIVVSSCTNIQEFYAPIVTDSACAGWTVVLSPPSGSFFAPNTTTLVDCFVSDYCGETNDCSFTVTVLPGANCPTNCITLDCPSNIVVTTCSNCLPVFYSALAANTCCHSNVVLSYSIPSGTCFNLGTTNVQVIAYDPDCASTPPATCSFTVTVLPGANCPTNCCSDCVPPYPDSYTVTIFPGTNYIADNLCQGTNNPLQDVVTGVPRRTTAQFWDDATQEFNLDTYAAGGWAFGTEPLTPGEGFILINPTTTPFTLTISGCWPNCPLPCAPPAGISFVGGYGTNPVQSWSNLFTCPPSCGTTLTIFDATNQTAATYVYNSVWTPPLPVPLLGVGQSAMLDATTNTGLTVYCSTNKTVPCGASWTFDEPTASDGCCTTAPSISVLSTVVGWSTSPCGYIYTRTWLATDCYSNTATCSQTVTVSACPCQAFNTGMSGGVALATGATDPNYVLVSVPPGAFGSSALVINPSDANGTYPLQDGPDSQWIGPDTTDLWEPAGVYHYQLQFGVCCTNGAVLSGQMVADNTAGVYLNGSQFVGFIPGFNGWTPISVSSGFVQGLNTLDIYLTNYSSSVEPGFSQTAFRAEVTNCTAPCCFVVSCPTNKTVPCGASWTFDEPTASNTCCTNPPSISVLSTVVGWSTTSCAYTYTRTWQVTDCDSNTAACSQTVTVSACPCQAFNTGMSGGVALATGATDPNYVLVSVPPGAFGSSALVIDPGSANGTYPLQDGPDSQWIGPDTTDLWEPAGVYHYQLQFGVCCTNGAVLSGQMVADNTAGVYLNGSQFVGFIPGFNSWTPISVSSGFVQGLNTLDIYVTNYSSSVEPGFSQTAFRAEVTNCTAPCCFVVSCPTDKTVPCDSVWTFDPPVATTCCTNLIATNGVLTTLLVVPATPVTNGVCPKVVTETWQISDGCGNSTTCSQTVSVLDTTPPKMTCPTNWVVTMTDCQLVIPNLVGQVSATDNCTPPCSLVYTQSPPAGTKYPCGTDSAVVCVTVTDLCGNSSQCCIHVVGMPSKASLVVHCPASVPVTNCVVPNVVPFVTATDLCCSCTSPPVITQQPAAGTPCLGGLVTVTVTDCGSTVTRNITLLSNGTNSFLGNLYNTGNSDNAAALNLHTSLLPDAATDPHYTLPCSAVPCGSMPADYVGTAVAISDASGDVPWSLAPDYNSPAAVSKWIAPDAVHNFSCPGGNYTYTLPFTLPSGITAATATIQGRFAADNGAVIYLNGGQVPASDGGVTLRHPDYGMDQWTYFTIPPGSGFSTGPNQLQFIVTNALTGYLRGEVPPEYTGLRVEFLNAWGNCCTCWSPSVTGITPAQTLPVGSTATFTVSAAGTPPLTLQWYFVGNGKPLVNNSHYSGVTTPTLRVNSLSLADAGIYTVGISNACGALSGYTTLKVTQSGWPSGLWNVAVLTNPLAATIGPDLVPAGTNSVAEYAVTAGSTEDFGLPELGGQVVNVMDINPNAAATIQVPQIAPAGSTTDNSYTVIMDIYQPDTSLGVPSTLFATADCCISNLSSGGQDGLTFTLDSTNNLHLTGSSAGVPFDFPSSMPLPVDTWNRLALVVDASNGILAGYLNGLPVINANPCPCCYAWITTNLAINWNISQPTLFSAPTDAPSPNAELFVSSVQFDAVAMTPAMIAGLGSPDNGPAPVSGQPIGIPSLSATLSNGAVNLTWTASPYALQETTSLSSGQWVDSQLPFTEAVGSTGGIATTAVVNPAPGAPAKFYRLVFRP